MGIGSDAVSANNEMAAILSCSLDDICSLIMEHAVCSVSSNALFYTMNDFVKQRATDRVSIAPPPSSLAKKETFKRFYFPSVGINLLAFTC
jgi:hypothetical protein